MTKKLVVLLAFSLAVACSSETEAPVVDRIGQAASQPSDTSAVTSRPAATTADPLSTPAVDPFSTPARAFAHQLELIRAEDFEGLRACMVSTAKDAVVESEVRDAKTRMGSVPASDIAADVRVRGEYADIVQKSTSVLTTLVRVDGKWLGQEAWWSPRAREK